MKRGEGSMSKVNLGLRRGIQIKMNLLPLRLTIREVVVPNFINVFAQIVGRNILRSVKPVVVDVMDVGRMITR